MIARSFVAVLTLAGATALSSAALAEQLVISIAEDETIFLQSTPVGMGALSHAIENAGTDPLNLRVDQQVRYEALGWVLQAMLATGRSRAILGEVKGVRNLPALTLFQHGEVVLPIRSARTTPALGTRAVVLYADFDGTLQLGRGGTAIEWDALPTLLEREAKKDRGTVVYVTANRITKVYSVERIVLAAQRQGLDTVVIADPV